MRKLSVNGSEAQRSLPGAFGLNRKLRAGRAMARAEDDDASRNRETREDRARDAARIDVARVRDEAGDCRRFLRGRRALSRAGYDSGLLD